MTPHDDLPETTTPDDMARDFAIRLHAYKCSTEEALGILLGAAMNYISIQKELERIDD